MIIHHTCYHDFKLSQEIRLKTKLKPRSQPYSSAVPILTNTC